jgi:hypothetical protein
MRFAVCVVLLAAGCAATSNPGSGSKDMAGGLAICPNHPEQCGGTCCGTRCADTMIDPINCGDCGIICTEGQLCSGGHCGCFPSGTKCGTGQTCCGAAGCKSLDSDVNNCGDCGKSCGSGATCSGGMCMCGTTVCGVNQVCCNGVCKATCAIDMGVAPPDMSGTSGACQCSSHCTTDPIGWCVGPECCYFDGISGACNIGPCNINMTP